MTRRNMDERLWHPARQILRNTDANLRDLERAWIANMDDLETEARYLVAWERAGSPGRDPRRHPLPGDIVEATAKTSWRRTDGEVRRFEVVSVEPKRTIPAGQIPPWASPLVEARVVRRFLGRSVGREFVPAINRADAIPTMSLHSDPFRDSVQLKSWRAWARDGVVLRRMPG